MTTKRMKRLRNLAVAGTVAFSVATSAGYDFTNASEACGIVAFVGKEPAVGFLMEGLQILQNRGYDSAGIATLTPDGKVVCTKFASKGSTSDCIDLLNQAAPAVHSGNRAGIAHTRWATHGGKTDENAHPHTDSKNRIALVHNGTIENMRELKAELEALGIHFKSQTDTEVIAQLVGVYLDQGMDVVDAFKKTLTRLHGTWGITLIHNATPDQIIAARNGSPLVVGFDDDRMFVASEVSAFSRYTRDFIALKDGEMAIVKSSGVANMDLSRVESAHAEVIDLSPAPYPHWTIKEIKEQPEAISRTLGYGGRFNDTGELVKLGGLDDNAHMMLDIQNLVMAACGTSLFASEYGAKLMRSLRCFDTVQPMDASEVNNDSFPTHHGGLLVVSQSGETKDTHRSVETAQGLQMPVLSVVNQVGSLIARSTSCGVYLNAGREHAVASTKAFTTQVTALALIAGWFAQNRSPPELQQRRTALMEAVHRLPIYTGLALKAHPSINKLASELIERNPQHMFILGKGYGEPIAREAALKIKEITYVHAEGFGGGALKHGPFALLQEGTPVILLILNDEHADKMRTAAQEVKARGAYNIVVTDKPELAEGISDFTVTIPSNGPLTALLGVVPLQLLAYEMSLAKGINPDKPKNLAKAVTVD